MKQTATERKRAEPAPAKRQDAPAAAPAEEFAEPTTCACGGGCPACSADAVPPTDGPSRTTTITMPGSVQRALGSPGRPLDPATRATMSAKFARAGVRSASRPSQAPWVATHPETIELSEPDDASEREADATASAIGGIAGASPPDEGPDFSDVRIHTDADAARSANDLAANAYAIGRHIVFGAGRYAPGTSGGQRLLAHELTHTLQSFRSPTIHRDGDRTANQGSVTMRVSMDGLHFEFPGFTLQEGNSRPQIIAMLLRRLLGEQYVPGVEDDVIKQLDDKNTTGSGHANKNSKVKAGEVPHYVNIDLYTTFVLIEILNKKKLQNTLTSDQVELLRNALFVNLAWNEIKDEFPPWYNEWLFRREMSQRGTLLEAYRTGRQSQANNGMDATMALNDIVGMLQPDADLVDRFRADLELAVEINKPTDDLLLKRDRESCSVAYSQLFRVQLAPGAKPSAPPEGTDVEKVANFLRYMRSQVPLKNDSRQDGAAGHDARVKLLGRFGRFTLRASNSTADEKILKTPALANEEPWKADLSSTPTLIPPTYEAALETDHAFTMNLHFAHFTDAMASYRYYFEFIKIPKKKSPGDKDIDVMTAAGLKPDRGKVMDARLARAQRYNVADLDRVQRDLGGLPFGQSAKNLAEANNAIRDIGTVVRATLEQATEPRYVTRFVFPSAGLYIVRCRAVPWLEGDEEIKRMPSVAFLPVTATDPDVMAVEQNQASTDFEFQVMLRIAEIQGLLQSPFPPENADALRKEMADLQLLLQSPKQALDTRKSGLDSQVARMQKRIMLRNGIASIEALPEAQRDAFQLRSMKQELDQLGGTEGNNWDDERALSRLEDQQSDTNNTIETQKTRGATANGALSTPKINFVSDLGSGLQLSVEMYDRGYIDGDYTVFMSDLTTPDSGTGNGSAPETDPTPRKTAILRALTDMLESGSDYGRGRAAINIDGKILVVDVQAGTGRLLTEALESAAMVGSLAAIVAAPFTGGASLYLLLPLGAVGAIPSTYRLYQRYDESRLRLDFAAAMDVVNIVGGLLGLAQAATPLRAVRLGQVLMVMGMGADGAGILMMGAGIAMQLDALRGMPEHERAAKLLEILGGAMLQIGIQAGGAIMHARYQSARTGGAAPEAGGKPLLDEPGFHPAPKEETPIDGSIAPPPATTEKPVLPSSDKSMASNPPKDGTAPVPSTITPKVETTAATPPPKNSPEHLLDKLSSGVDRSLPPSPGKDKVIAPQGEAKAGVFEKGLMDGDAAYASYNKALARAGGREVAIYYNPATGEYRVMVGHETGVSAPEAYGWRALLHYHPNEGNVLTFRLPAPQDFAGLMMRYVSEGVLVREFLEFDIPGVGRGRTEFGIDPNSSEPFYVKIHHPDGTTRTTRFAHDGHYSAYWGERKIGVPENSPVYDSMVRDIQAYLKSIGKEDAGGFGPPKESTPSTDPSGPSGGSQDKSAAKKPVKAPLRELQTGDGSLTKAGVDFIRENFATTTDASGKSVRTESLTDAEIMGLYPNKPSWLEKLVTGQARADWIGRTSKTDFLMSNPRQDFKLIAKRLLEAAMAGNTGHTVHDAILDWNVSDFVTEMLAQKDPTMTAAYDACQNNTDPAFKRRWNEFRSSQAQGDMSGFFLGKVGSKRPDIVEVMLSSDTIHITDATMAYGDPIHNFKSAFYRVVMERLITVGTVTSTDYRAPLKQTPM
jgi:Domain of unknown function (DUF4157)